MRRTTFIFTILLAAGCADFNPDLSGLDGGETGSGTSGETEGGSTSTTGDGDGDGDGDETGSTDGDTSGNPDMGTPDGFCGDGTVNGDEECDSSDMNDETCETQGFDFGDVSCRQDCTVNTDMCGVGTCNPQPQDGPLSPCEVPMQGGGFCEDNEACVGEPGQTGMCSASCSSDVDCAVPGYAGCEAAPRCLMQQCVYECSADYMCPNPMSCVFSEVLQTSICL
jgi:hypothetical protein